MGSNEILTLQFGHYSNFVGTHWWNIQENSFQYNPDSPSETNHDVLFREGQTQKGEITYTPRLLLCDLKGSLKALPKEGELYNSAHYEPNADDYEVCAKKREEKNEFQKDLSTSGVCQTKKIYDLDNEVCVWSDFLYTRFHPRSVNVIKEYQHSDEQTPFDIFPLGTNLWKTEHFSEDFSDKIRNYIEECNQFQGFHVLLDSTNAFSGLSVACLEYLQDEYDTKSVLGFPTTADPTSKNPVDLLNLALCYDGLSEHSSLFTPLAICNNNFPLLKLKPHLMYHSSAVLAGTLDTLTLNHRLKTSQHTMIDLCSDFSTNRRKACAASTRFPFRLEKNEDFIDCLDNWKGPLSQSITPGCQINFDNSLQLVVLRGIPESKLKRPSHLASQQRLMPAYKCETLKEMLSYYLACTCFGTKSEVTVTKEQLAVKTPFPQFFDDRIDETGSVGSENAKINVESVNVLAGLHTGKFIGDMFDDLFKDLEKIRYKRFHRFASEGFENDQFKECFDRILDLRDCYQDDYLI